MEKRVFSLIFALFLIFSGFSQEISIQEKIRMPLWAELDAYPELKEAQDTQAGQFDFPISRIKELSQFLLNGMTYGWNFSYTPKDKIRNVEESFEFSEINSISNSGQKIVYSKPWIEDGKFNCWVEFERSEQMIREFKMWHSINFDKIQGKGLGKISDGFDGIIEASKNSLKNAIREHYREIIKNKPKEIRGKVIIRKLPKIGIISGRYSVELDFFLETNRILKYRYY